MEFPREEHFHGQMVSPENIHKNIIQTEQFICRNIYRMAYKYIYMCIYIHTYVYIQLEKRGCEFKGQRGGMHERA